MSPLSWWFAAHPAWEPGEDWPQEVPVVCYEADDEIVLIDPFLPQDGSFDPHGRTVRVLLTQGAHHRGTAEVVERYGALVWTPPHAVWRKIPNPATTDELPAGIEALQLDGEPQQVVFFIREHATLVTGDVLTGSCRFESSPSGSSQRCRVERDRRLLTGRSSRPWAPWLAAKELGSGPRDLTPSSTRVAFSYGEVTAQLPKVKYSPAAAEWMNTSAPLLGSLTP